MSVAQAGASEQLSPAEEAFFTSRGSDTSAFETPSTPSPAPDAGTPAPGPAAIDPPAGGLQPAAAAAPANPAMPQTDDELIAQFEQEAVDGSGKAVSGGQFIRRENFRVVSTKYKQTKQELQTERDARQKIETEASDLRSKFARMDERLRLFNEAAAKPAAPPVAAPAVPAPMPDPADDIFGAFRWQGQKIADLEKRLEQTAQDAGKTAETFQQSTAETQLRTAYANDFRNFSVQNPDVGQAYNHYLTVRHATLEAAGYADKAERIKIIEDEERGIAQRAFQTQQSPAAIIYNIAKHIGYQKAADPNPVPAAASAPVAATPAAAPAAPAAPSAVDQVTRVAAAQAAARSLSSGGGSPVIQMSIEQLLAMDDTQFAAYERANPGVVKKLMGG